MERSVHSFTGRGFRVPCWSSVSTHTHPTHTHTHTGHTPWTTEADIRQREGDGRGDERVRVTARTLQKYINHIR